MTGVRSQLTRQTISGIVDRLRGGGVGISAAPKEEGMSGLLEFLFPGSYAPIHWGLDIFMRQMQGGGGKQWALEKVNETTFGEVGARYIRRCGGIDEAKTEWKKLLSSEGSTKISKTGRKSKGLSFGWSTRYWKDSAGKSNGW